MAVKLETACGVRFSKSQFINVERGAPVARFTIVMANFNNGLYVDDAIRSVRGQTFQDWQLLIVDDASTDESISIIEKHLSDSRIRLLALPENRGYTRALLVGIASAASEIIGILDSDDALVVDALQRVEAAYSKYPDIGVVLTQAILCNAALKPMHHTRTDARHLKEPLLWMRGSTAFRTFTKAAYLRTGGIDPRMASGEDSDLLFKLEEVALVHRIDEHLYLYRQLPSSQSKAALKYAITYRCIALAVFNAYRRRRGTSVPCPSTAVVSAWVHAAVRYSLELGEPLQALVFAGRAIALSPLAPASRRALMQALRGGWAQQRAPDPQSLTRKFFPVREFQSGTGNVEPDRIVCIPLVHKRGHCIFGGDYYILTAGRYRVTFELLVRTYGIPSGPVAVLDVYENDKGKGVVGLQEVIHSDNPITHTPNRIDFDATAGDRLEFRVFWSGQCFLAVTGVLLEPLQ